MTDILTLAKENGFSHIGFADMSALTPLEAAMLPAQGHPRRGALAMARASFAPGAGCCTICAKCTYPDKPCRYPSKRLSSMEAFGLFVSDICARSGLGYNYGPRTMTYTSCLLYSEE